MVKNPHANVADAHLIPGLRRSPGEKMAPTPVFLPGKSHGQRSLVSYSPWGHKRPDLVTKQQQCMLLIHDICFSFSDQLHSDDKLSVHLYLYK